ncbi:MAG: hypothetical protein M1839_000616 [Geoglossum umbratile]|nr:MAG: hypothetical protein M1839_000616 [Geoglossum umbratile]
MAGYLSSDASGALSAHAEAMSPAETFQIAPHASGAPGGFAVQTARDTYLSFSPANDPISPASPSLPPSPHARPADPPPHALYIRMQTAHKARLATSLAAKAREKISRRELEDMVGRRLEEEEVRRLKRARREGGFYEAVLDVRVKGKHDKFAC